MIPTPYYVRPGDRHGDPGWFVWLSFPRQLRSVWVPDVNAPAGRMVFRMEFGR